MKFTIVDKKDNLKESNTNENHSYINDLIKVAQDLVDYFQYHNKNTTKAQDAKIDDVAEVLKLIRDSERKNESKKLTEAPALRKKRALKEDLSYGELVAIAGEWEKYKKKVGSNSADTAWDFIEDECAGVYDTDEEKDDIFGYISTLEETNDDLDESKKNLNEGETDDFTFKAFITNLGKYNEGELVGKWVEFPIDEDDFDEILKSIGISDEPDDDGVYYEEWFVTDYECDLPGFDWNDLGEYPSYDSLQEFGELVEKANDFNDADAISDAYEVTGDLGEALDGLENGDITFYPGVSSDSELGEYVIDSVYGGKISTDLAETYFDYDKLGRDLRIDYYQEGDDMPETAEEYYCGDENASDYDIGVAFVDEVGLDGVANIDYYFDYESFGRDLTYESFTLTTHGAIQYI